MPVNEHNEKHVDGNALAGPLSEVVDVDITTTSAKCAGCGDTAVLAQAMVYEKPHSFIVRCSRCDAVLMIVLQKREATEIDLRGIAWLGVPRALARG
jgi:ribosomal protein S27AE